MRRILFFTCQFLLVFQLSAQSDMEVGGTTITNHLKVIDGAQNGFILVADSTGLIKWVHPDSLIHFPDDGDWTIVGDTIMYNTDIMKVGIGTDNPQFPLTIQSSKNPMLNNDSIDISELNLVIANPLGNNGGGSGLGFQNSDFDTDIGAAIVHENTGPHSKGNLHFATKSGIEEGTNLKIGMTLNDQGRIGIGTINPSPYHPLTVEAPGALFQDSIDINTLAARFRSATENTSGIGFGNNEFPSAALITEDIMFDTMEGGALHFGTRDSLTPGDAALPIRMTIDESGKVGIGTTSPTQRLDVSGKLRLRQGGNDGFIAVSDADGVLNWTDPDDIDIVDDDWIQLNDTTYYSEAQFIGIGTTSPTHQLTVADSSNAMFSVNRVDVSNLSTIFSRNSEEDNTATGIGFGISTDPRDIGAAIIHERTNFNSIGKLHFATQDAGIFENILIHMTISDNRNVGIATRNPTERLDVSGKIRMRFGSEEGFVAVSDEDGVLSWTHPDSILGPFDTDWTVMNSEMYNDKAKRIGIGTDDPTHQLTIAENKNALASPTMVDISNLSTIFGKYEDINNEATGIGFQSSTHTGDIGAAIIHERTGVSSMGKLHFATKASNIQERDLPINMTIGDNGKVGIGNVNPDFQLHVSEDMQVDNGTFNVFHTTNQVSVGTTFPTHKLTIGDTSNALANSNTVDVDNLLTVFSHYSNNDNEAAGIGFQSALTGSKVGAAIIHERTGSSSKGKLHFATKTSNSPGDIPIHMTISDDGRVGIGTTDPEFQLTVANGLKVDGEMFNIRNSQDRIGVGTANPETTLHAQASASGEDTFIMLIDNPGNTNSDENNGLEIRAGHDTHSATQESDYVRFSTPNGATAGAITQHTNSSVIYSTTSDARLKSEIIESNYGINELMQVEVLDYKYKSDPGKIENGYLAQQLYKIYPFAVTPGGEDPNKEPWMVDYGRITPLLLQSIQDQQNQIKYLENKHTAELKHMQSQIDELYKVIQSLKE